MEKPKGRRAAERLHPALLSFPLFLFLLSWGCGAPGEPTPPSPPIPAPITDLSARQQGNGVQLVFTLPGRTTTGDRLAEPPAIEIFRGGVKADGKVDNKSFRQVYTIPGALADTYLAQGKIQFIDPVAPQDRRAAGSADLAYRVRTRASKKKDSGDSNTVVAKLYPVADRIRSLEARVTEKAIELSWREPQDASGARETVAAYHVYRGELDRTAPLPAPSDLSQAKWKSPPLLVAPVQTPSYHDNLFDFGKAYVYFVRSVSVADGNPVESDDSEAVVVTPEDTFPPAAPRNVVAAIVPTAAGGRLADLSWSINLESDLAGYRVYRSEREGERGAPLQADLLLSPACQDPSVLGGHRYWYVVTAVDRAGNESGPSEAVLADLALPPP
jgi:hypothetical protein